MELVRSVSSLAKSKHKQASKRFINRELSWLQFNERVLDEANNPNHPLLERVRFLAISDSNLDEFYMVRVAGLKNQLEVNPNFVTPDGLTVQQQLTTINKKARELVEMQNQTCKHLLDELSHQGISIVKAAELSRREKTWLKKYFNEQIFPVLTPLAVDPAHPFPYIPNDGLCIVLKLNTPKDKVLWSLVPLPKNLPRLTPVMGQPRRFLMLEDIVAEYFRFLFPEFEILSHGLFHLIRDSEMEIDEDVEDLISMFKTALLQRRQGNVIRLMVNEDIPDDLMNFVIDELEVDNDDVFPVHGLLNMDDLKEMILPEFAPLQFPVYTPRLAPAFKYNSNYFDAIRKSDIMVHHPYESFNAVIEFLYQAARDPAVLAIKQTLYRTSVDSPIVKALITASEAGKNVTAVVELKARFDEEENIRMAEILERAGVHVIFGFMDFKTHCKMSMIVRKESNRKILNYVHFGTGNYNPVTAKIYTDISLFTCDKELCLDAAKVFNYLTGYARPHQLDKLIISPTQMQEQIVKMIRRETDRAKETGIGRIWMKMNALVDPVIIEALYEASEAGVVIDCVIRGICCLRPGIPGMSSNIRVKSIVGRFLEHSRIICFGNGEEIPSANTSVLISSADWMPRNFHSRVETLIPIEEESLKKYLLEQVMTANLKDEGQSWVLHPDGTYERVNLNPDAFSAQSYFMDPAPLGEPPNEETPSPKLNQKRA